MNDFILYGIGALLVCFTILTFLLSRLKTDIFPEEYEFQLDPFWYIIGVMFLGGMAVYFLYPEHADTIKQYHFTDVLLPFFFAAVIYFCYLLDIHWITNLVTFLFALGISYIQPDDFCLFSGISTPFQDKLAIAVLIFIFSKGLGLLNGIGGIASMQFLAVMISAVILTYFDAVPQLLGCLAMAYFGTMLAFTFFSWPPEKIVVSNGGFACLGFVMGCFMLDASVEFADAPMLIAASYLVTEMGVSLYNRYIYREKTDNLYMNTSYYKISDNGKYDLAVVYGVGKMLIIDVVLSMMQIVASTKLALPVFAVALNLWFLSILSGDTNPEQLLSLSKWGKKVVKGVFARKKGKK